MSDHRAMTPRRGESSGTTSPTWWIVFSHELRDLWVGGKALYLILIYSVLLGIYSFLLASNAEVNLLPLKEMVLEMVKASIAVGLFICLIIAADSFSGERERSTLEGLLLTPTSRRQIVVGKFLAAISSWPAALVIAIPYWVVLSKGDPVFGQAMLWGTLLGTLLAPAFAALGVLASIWCKTNKTSMLVSLCLYLLLLLPTDIMGGPQKTLRTAEQWFRAELNQWINPLAATSRFLWKIMVNDQSPGTLWFWHVMPVVFVLLVVALLFAYASPRLRLDPETERKFRSFMARWRRAPSPPAPRRVARDVAPEPQVLLVPPVVPRKPARPRVTGRGVEPSPSASSTWWLVCKRELHDLWVGGRALQLTLIYAIVLGVYAYIMARDSVLSLVPPKEMVLEICKAGIFASVVVGLIIGADGLSGERERATLEGLLLTPTSRRQIVVGKFAAAISPWPAAMAITIPFLKVLSQGDEVFGQSVLWCGVLGSVLTPAFTALGMFVGFYCNSNKTSLFVSLCLFILFLLPTQLPGHAQGGAMGLFFQWVNPLAAPRVFLASILVNNWTMDRAWSWLMSPVVFAALTFALLFWYASPGLRLEGGKATTLRWSRAGVAAGLMAALLVFVAGPAMALRQGTSQAASSAASQTQVQVTIDVQAKAVKAGTPVEYHTVVTNTGPEASPPLIAAMNIINLNKQGEVVDPEDWSPQRTQYMDGLAPGQSDTLSWRINAILDGNYMVYMVVIPAPSGPEATSHPVTSPGIHLMVSKYTRLNPGGVLPYAIGGPVVLGLVIFFVYRRRHREIDAGGET